MIEIAPNLFVKSWDDVLRGYIHGCVDFKDGRCVHVSDHNEIQRAVALWRSLSEAPFHPKEQKVPKDIVRWMGKTKAGYHA